MDLGLDMSTNKAATMYKISLGTLQKQLKYDHLGLMAKDKISNAYAVISMLLYIFRILFIFLICCWFLRDSHLLFIYFIFWN